MSASTQPVFEITFGCGNCGESWEESYPSRTKVFHDYGDVRVVDTEEIGFGNSDVMYCPTCELSDEVTIDDRTPLDESSVHQNPEDSSNPIES